MTYQRGADLSGVDFEDLVAEMIRRLRRRPGAGRHAEDARAGREGDGVPDQGVRRVAEALSSVMRFSRRAIRAWSS